MPQRGRKRNCYEFGYDCLEFSYVLQDRLRKASILQDLSIKILTFMINVSKTVILHRVVGRNPHPGGWYVCKKTMFFLCVTLYEPY